jgi:hypothetical protein
MEVEFFTDGFLGYDTVVDCFVDDPAASVFILYGLDIVIYDKLVRVREGDRPLVRPRHYRVIK